MFKRYILNLINKYQEAGGGYKFFSVECNFDPTCSEYFKQAVEKYGLLKGFTLGLRRIRKCTNTDTLTKEYDPVN